MMGGDWSSGWMGFGGGIWMILTWLLLILGVVIVVRWFWGRPTVGSDYHNPTSLDILRERYARGEIDRGEYEQKRRDLSG